MSESLSRISDLEPKNTTRIKPPVIHPVWLRLTHWVNALAVLIMIGSGWRIYNASPLFGFSFPNDITLGGWLGGAWANQPTRGISLGTASGVCVFSQSPNLLDHAHQTRCPIGGKM